MLTCFKCKESLEENNFYTRPDRINKYQSYCKSCFNTFVKERWIKRKEKAILYKGNCCYDCKQQFPREVYEFHHVNPLEKDFDWKKLRLKSWDKVEKELEKTVLLCANCHRIRHIKSNPTELRT